MQRLRNAVIAVAVPSWCLAACTPGDSTLARAGAELALEDTILALAGEYNDAWGTLDVGTIVEYHAEGFAYYWFDERISADFATTLGEIWLADTQAYSIDMVDPDVDILGADAAVISFRFNDRQLYESGDVVATQGAMGYIFERGDGGWKIVRVHHSGPVPEEYR